MRGEGILPEAPGKEGSRLEEKSQECLRGGRAPYDPRMKGSRLERSAERLSCCCTEMQGEGAVGILPGAEKGSHEGSGRKKGRCVKAEWRNRDGDGSASASHVWLVSV